MFALRRSSILLPPTPHDPFSPQPLGRTRGKETLHGRGSGDPRLLSERPRNRLQLATLGAYVGLFALYKITRSKPKFVEAPLRVFSQSLLAAPLVSLFLALKSPLRGSSQLTMFALRRSSILLRPATSFRRNLSGGHGEKKHYTGVEAVIRGYFPSDHEIVLATLGAYVGLFALYKITRSKPKFVEAPIVVEEVNTGKKDDIPSVADEKFEKWSQNPANMAKWEKSLEKAFA